VADYIGQKMYYTQLTDALRQYMEERFGFNAMEMTSAEIVAELRNHGDTELQELTSLFETADLVKFAKYTAGVSENDKNLLSAVAFINDTKQENVPMEERIEPTITKQQRQTMQARTWLKISIGIMIILATAIIVYVCWQLYDIRA
jgi:CHASE3 domain sensor protein